MMMMMLYVHTVYQQNSQSADC